MIGRGHSPRHHHCLPGIAPPNWISSARSELLRPIQIRSAAQSNRPSLCRKTKNHSAAKKSGTHLLQSLGGHGALLCLLCLCCAIGSVVGTPPLCLALGSFNQKCWPDLERWMSEPPMKTCGVVVVKHVRRRRYQRSCAPPANRQASEDLSRLQPLQRELTPDGNEASPFRA